MILHIFDHVNVDCVNLACKSNIRFFSLWKDWNRQVHRKCENNGKTPIFEKNASITQAEYDIAWKFGRRPMVTTTAR